MERTGSTRPIQGGGDGIGFRPPRQMTRMERNKLMKISREAIGMARMKQEDEKKFMLRAGNLDEMRECKMKTWTDALSNRFFTLRRRSDETRNPSSVPLVPECGAESPSLPGCGNELMRLGSSTVPASTSPISEMLLKKWVPGIPRTIEKTVQLWRVGDPLCQQVAIRKLNTAARRKSVIGAEQYSDKKWDRTGNKRRFLRIQELIKLVLEGSNISNIEEEGSDIEWKAAIIRFHEKWDIEGKPRALSTILKQK